MSIGLLMIVRDAADKLPACLASVKPLISSWTIIDTGSEDETKAVIRRELRHVPGNLVLRPWVNFAHNRSELLRFGRAFAAPGEYLLMLDADHEVEIRQELPELTADSYLISIEDGWGGRLPLLTRAAHPFEYRGAAHAYLASDAPTRTENLDAIIVKGGDGASREKLERDRAALEAAFLEDSTDPRTVFYLASTYRDLDMHEEAIRYYRLRAEMGGFDEERFFARYQLGVLLTEHVSFADGAVELLRAWEERPHRIEPLRALSNAAASVADKYPVPNDSLFVQRHLYRNPDTEGSPMVVTAETALLGGAT